MKQNLQKITLLANLFAIAIVLNIVERYIVVIPVPGAKIGLSNIVVLIVLLMFGFKEAFLVVIFKTVLVGLLYSSFGVTFIMGLSGGIVSVLVMYVIYKLKFHPITISVIGAVFHTLGQVVAGIFILDTPLIIYYLPLMLIISVPAGILTGILSQRFIKIYQKKQPESKKID